MLAHYAMGIVGVVVVSLAWVGVQVAWRRAFAGVSTDPDALAGRTGCHGCGCTDDREGQTPDVTGAAREE